MSDSEPDLSRLSASELAELEAIRQSRNVETFEAFVGRVERRFWPVPRHLRKLYELIQRTRYEQVFATISEPPRHGKTTSFALAFAYRLLYDPACQNFYTTYAGKRSADVGLATMRIVESLGVPLDPKNSSVLDFSTLFGGGLQSTSKGGQITGGGSNGGLVVCDDLLKGHKEARSQLARDDVHDYITTDVMSRIEGGASLIIMNTRWHDDDPIGRIMKNPMGLGEIAGTKPWIHINEPAVGDEYGNPIDERLYPELAHPLWLDVDAANPGSHEAAMRWYAVIRARNEAAWWALYQGTPRSDKSKIFQEPSYYNLPGSKEKEDDAQPFDWDGKRGCIVLDPAASEKTTADFNAIGCVAMEGYGDSAIGYLVDVHKEQMSIPAAARMALAWQRRYRLPLVIESVGGFKAVPQIINEIVPKMKIIEPPMRGDKVQRSAASAAAWNTGRYRVPAGVDKFGRPMTGIDWVEDTVRVARLFTGVNDDEDDVVDMMAHGFNYLLGTIDVMRRWRGMSRGV